MPAKLSCKRFSIVYKKNEKSLFHSSRIESSNVYNLLRCFFSKDGWQKQEIVHRIFREILFEVLVSQRL